MESRTEGRKRREEKGSMHEMEGKKKKRGWRKRRRKRTGTEGGGDRNVRGVKRRKGMTAG